MSKKHLVYTCVCCEMDFGVAGKDAYEELLGGSLDCPNCKESIVLDLAGATFTQEQANEILDTAKAVGLIGYDSRDNTNDSELVMLSVYDTEGNVECLDDYCLVEEISHLEKNLDMQFSVKFTDAYTKFKTTGRLDKKSRLLLRNSYILAHSFGFGEMMQ